MNRFKTSNIALDQLADGFVCLDPKLNITSISPFIEKRYGPRVKWLGQPFKQCAIASADRDIATYIQQAIVTNEVQKYESLNEKMQEWYEVRIVPSEQNILLFFNDITRYKRYEHHLTTYQMKQRALAESNIIGIVTYDKTGLWTDANHAMLQLLGFSYKDLENGLLSNQSLTPPEWISADDEAIARLRDYGYTGPYEKEFFDRNGIRVQVLLSITQANTSSRDEGGVAYVLDISRHKQTQDHVLLSAEAAKIAFWDWNINDDFAEWTNPWPFLSPQQIKQTTSKYTASISQFFDLLHPDDRASAQARTIEVLNQDNDPNGSELRIILKDGRVRWAQIYHRTFFDKDGKPYRSIGSMHDITLMKEAAQALQASEQKFKTIANELAESQKRLDIALTATHMSVWELDLRTMVTKHSQNCHLLFGISQATESWDFQSFTQFVHPDDRDMVIGNMSRIPTERESYEHAVEFRVIWPDGSIHWLYSRSQAICNPDTREPEKLMGALVEITDLKVIQTKLEDAVSIRDEFLSVASHELRTPITSLNLQNQILQKLAGAEISGNDKIICVQKHIDAMNIQIKKLASLVDDLLDVTRIENGKLILSREKCDLAEIVKNVHQSMYEQFISAKCRVDLVGDGEIIGQWDRQKIERVIVNLLTNACKYGRGNPVHVYILQHKGSARIMVKDFGIGISQEYQSRIFGRFERAVRGSAFSGLGLGLFISKQIVSAHGGEINVYSKEGEGSTFTVDLPLAEISRNEHLGVS